MEEEISIQTLLHKIDLIVNYDQPPEQKESINFQIFEEIKNEKLINVPNYGEVLIIRTQKMNQYKSEIKKFEKQVKEILPKVMNLSQTLIAKDKQLNLISIENEHLKKEFIAQTAKIENILKKNINPGLFQFPQAQFFINVNDCNEKNSKNNSDKEISLLKNEIETLQKQIIEYTKKEAILSNELISKTIETLALHKDNDQLKLSLQKMENDLENAQLSITHLKKNIFEKTQFSEQIKEQLEKRLKDAKNEMIGSQEKWTEHILNLNQIQNTLQIDFPYYTETQARLELKVENELLRERLKSVEEELGIEKNNNKEMKINFNNKMQEFENIKENILKNLENSVQAIERETLQKFEEWIKNNQEAYASWEKIKELQENFNDAIGNLDYQKKINFELKQKLDLEIEEKTKFFTSINLLEQEKSNLEQALLELKVAKEEEIFELQENLEDLGEKFNKIKKEYLELSSEIELLNLRRQRMGQEEPINEKLYSLYKNKFEDSDYQNLLLKNELKVLKKKLRIENKPSLLKNDNFSDKIGNMNIMNNFKDTENFLEGLLQTNKELEQEREQNKELAARNIELFALRERIEKLEKLKNIRRLGLF